MRLSQQRTKMGAATETNLSAIIMSSINNYSTCRIVTRKVLCKNVVSKPNNVISLFIVLALFIYYLDEQVQQTTSSLSNRQHPRNHSWPIKRPRISSSHNDEHIDNSTGATTDTTGIKTGYILSERRDNHQNEMNEGLQQDGSGLNSNNNTYLPQYLLSNQDSTEEPFDIRQFTRYLFNEDDFFEKRKLYRPKRSHRQNELSSDGRSRRVQREKPDSSKLTIESFNPSNNKNYTTHLPMILSSSTHDTRMFDDSVIPTTDTPQAPPKVIRMHKHRRRSKDDRARARIPGPMAIIDDQRESAIPGLADASTLAHGEYSPGDEPMSSLVPPEETSSSSLLNQANQEVSEAMNYNETSTDDLQDNTYPVNNNNAKHRNARIVDAITVSPPLGAQFNPENSITGQDAENPTPKRIEDSYTTIKPPRVGDSQVLMASGQSDEPTLNLSDLSDTELKSMADMLQNKKLSLQAQHSRAHLLINSRLPNTKLSNGYHKDTSSVLYTDRGHLNAPYVTVDQSPNGSRLQRYADNMNGDHSQDARMNGLENPWSPSNLLHQRLSSHNHAVPTELPQELVTNLERNFYSSSSPRPSLRYSVVGRPATPLTPRIPPYQTQMLINKTAGNNLEKQFSTLNSQHVSSSTIKRAIQPVHHTSYPTATNFRADPSSSINLVELNESQQHQPALNWLRTLSTTTNSASIPLYHYSGQIAGSQTAPMNLKRASSMNPVAAATISRSMYAPSTAFSIVPFSTSTKYTRTGNAQHRISRNTQSSNNDEASGSQPSASSVSASDPMWSDTQNQEDEYQQAPQTIQITAVPNGVGAFNGWNGFNGVNGVNGWGNSWNGWAGGPLVNGRPVVMFNQRQPVVGSTSEWRQWVLPVAAILALPLILGSLFVPLFLKSVMFLIQILQMLGLLMPPGQLAGHLGSSSHASVSG